MPSQIAEFLARSGARTPKELMDVCRSENLWVTVSPDNNLALLTRLRTGRRGGRTRRPSLLEQESNGVVVELGDASPRLLAVPPRSFTHSVSASNVNRHLAHKDGSPYDVTVAYDGTVVTLYCHRGVWRMASARGYDVSTLKWVGEQTFAEAFATSCHEAAKAGNPAFDAHPITLGEDGRLVIDMPPDIAEAFSWTVGYSNLDSHVLGGCYAAWQIQATDLKSGMLSSTAPRIAPAPVAGPSYRTLREYRDNVDRIENLNFAGWVFRSRNPKATGLVSDFLVESARMKSARTLIYARPPAEIQRHLTSRTRPYYWAARVWSQGRTDEYLRLRMVRGEKILDAVRRAHEQLTEQVHAQLVRRLASGESDPPENPVAIRVLAIIPRGVADPTDHYGKEVIGDILKAKGFRLELAIAAEAMDSGAPAEVSATETIAAAAPTEVSTAAEPVAAESAAD